jgi:hypothetical protein
VQLSQLIISELHRIGHRATAATTTTAAGGLAGRRNGFALEG